MKILFTVFIALIIFINAKSQENKSNSANETSKSKSELFMSKPGTLIEKEIISIGKITTGSGFLKKNISVGVLKLTNLLDNSINYSLRFEYVHTGQYVTDTKVGAIDSDELENFIKILQLMDSEYLHSTRTNYTELIFVSRGGLETGCFYSDGKWTIFLKLEKYDKDSYIFLNAEDISSIYSQVILAKGHIK